MEYTTKSYWEDQALKFNYEIAPHNDQLRQFLEKWVPKGVNKTAIEIGCVPGRYLACLGELGYRLSGIDILPNAVKNTRQWLDSQGYQIQDFYCTSFDDLRITAKYDLVCSFGFIEHFENYFQTIQRHIDLVASQGLMIITTPNFFGGVQNILHRWLDKENLKRHNVDSMKPDLWCEYICSSEFEILYSGYFGYFTFWVEENDHRSPFKKLMVDCIKKTLPLTSRILPSTNQTVSPFCGVVARKKI